MSKRTLHTYYSGSSSASTLDTNDAYFFLVYRLLLVIHEECGSGKVWNVDLCWLVMKKCIFYFYLCVL